MQIVLYKIIKTNIKLMNTFSNIHDNLVENISLK